MVSGWVDYPTRKKRGYRWNRRSTKWTQRYSNNRRKRQSGRTEYTNIKGMGMMPTYGFRGGQWQTRGEIAPGVLGPWTPALT